METGESANEEQPFYVNAKQYHRILKRRIARARLEESLKSAPGRKPYLHESRHKHAMRRPRGQGGRFLTAAEIAEKNRMEQEQKGNGTSSELSNQEVESNGDQGTAAPSDSGEPDEGASEQANGNSDHKNENQATSEDRINDQVVATNNTTDPKDSDQRMDTNDEQQQTEQTVQQKAE